MRMSTNGGRLGGAAIPADNEDKLDDEEADAKKAISKSERRGLCQCKLQPRSGTNLASKHRWDQGGAGACKSASGTRFLATFFGFLGLYSHRLICRVFGVVEEISHFVLSITIIR